LAFGSEVTKKRRSNDTGIAAKTEIE